ncbi:MULTISPECIES: hypothetical protein [Xanthomonas]|uniref:hypothetical protein n=1 Tax=Xanthomonas TaxID=338 RepID=UPI00103D7A7A|nr:MULTISPECIES: hypothetical protein [Xanthomonas]
MSGKQEPSNGSGIDEIAAALFEVQTACEISADDVADVANVAREVDKLPVKSQELPTEEQLCAELRAIWEKAEEKGYSIEEFNEILGRVSRSDGHVNIARIGVAAKVRVSITDSYYRLLLDALQTKAEQLGFYFALSDIPVPGSDSPVLLEALAKAVQYRKASYLYPSEESSRWERSVNAAVRDGSALRFVQEIIEGLRRAGICLRSGKNSFPLLYAEGCRQREARTGTSNPLSGYEIDEMLSYIKARLGVSNE